MNAIKERKIVYTSDQIAERVRAMAAEIDAFYGDEPLVAVCVPAMWCSARTWTATSPASMC